MPYQVGGSAVGMAAPAVALSMVVIVSLLSLVLIELER